jgi:hypothetical protein
VINKKYYFAVTKNVSVRNDVSVDLLGEVPSGNFALQFLTYG